MTNTRLHAQILASSCAARTLYPDENIFARPDAKENVEEELSCRNVIYIHYRQCRRSVRAAFT
jgi:hypothetical protein